MATGKTAAGNRAGALGSGARPTLRQLEYFVAVAEAGSFRRAAQRLGVTQPTLTAQVASLEQALGIALLERGRRGTVLSPYGREALVTIRHIQQEMQGLIDSARSANEGPSGVHRLGVPPTLGPYFLPHVVPELHRSYPALRFYVRENVPDALQSELQTGTHDLILTSVQAVGEDLIYEVLFEEPLKVVVAIDHPLASLGRVPINRLQGENILTLEEHHLLYRQVNDLCDRIGARVLRDYEGTSLDTLRQMAGMGLGVALLPSLYVESEISRRSGIIALDFADEVVSRTIAMAWRPTAPQHKLYQQMADSIRRIIRRKLPRVVTASSRRLSRPLMSVD